jgi:hypothetical protein
VAAAHSTVTAPHSAQHHRHYREVKIFKDVPESGRPETAKSGIQYFL